MTLVTFTKSKTLLFFPSFAIRSFCFFMGLLAWLSVLSAQAQTWSNSPGSGDWNTAANWSPAAIPNSTAATAVFGASNTNSVSLSAPVTLDSALFNLGAPSYTITDNAVSLSFQGAGLLNSSGVAQTLVGTNSSVVNFYNSSAVSNVVIKSDDDVFFNDNSTAGNSNIYCTTLVRFFNQSSAAGATINMNGGGIVDFHDSASGGSGRFIINNGEFDISGVTITGGVTVGSIEGNGTFNLGSNNLTTDVNNLSTTVSGPIVGNGGSLTKVGTGTLTLTNGNSYTGGTTVSAGTLAVDTSGDLGSGAVKVLAAGGLNYMNSAIAGGTTFTIAGAMNFNDTSNANNSTILNSGTVNFNNSSMAYSSVITNNNILTFNNTSTAGQAIVTTNSGGLVSFTGLALGGSAQFTTNSLGSFDVSQVSSGVTVGSIAGAGTYYLGAKALTTGVNNLSTTVSGLITGGGLGGGTGGSLTKMGTGTLTLSGTDTYSGGTVVLQGTLAVASPGALGTGLVLVNGGTFETGGGPLTINVGGSYTQSSSGTLQMGLGGTAAGQWDILKVTGNASLAGTLQVVSDSGFTPVIGNTFLILGASGVSGTFSSLANPFTSIRLLPLYGSTGVQLEAIVPSFSQVALTPNQKVVANLLDQVFLDTSLQNLIASLGIQSAGSLPGDFDQISPVGLTPVYKIGFELARAQALFVGQRMDEIWGGNNLGGSSARAINGDGPMLAANMSAEQERAMTKTVSMKNPWDVFVNGNGNFGTVTADSNSPGYQFTTGGLTAGLDYRLGKDLVGGLLLGYSQTNATQANGGSVNVTGGQAGLYGGWQSQSFHLEALVDGGMNSYKTSRAGYGGTAQASPQGIQYGGQLGFGYDWQVEDLTLGPFASGQYTYVQLNGFSEQGSLAPLNLPAQGQGSLLSDLGARVSADWTSGNFVLSPNLSVAWEHQYQGNQDSLTAGLVTGGNQFSINGPATGTDAAVVGAGLSAQFNKGMNAYVQYQGKIGLTNYDSQNFSGGVNFAF